MVSVSLTGFSIKRNHLKDNTILVKPVIRTLSSNEGKAPRSGDLASFCKFGLNHDSRMCIVTC